MDMAKDEDIGKLGTVLAVANQINRDMLEMLERQQEMLAKQQARQAHIIQCSIVIIAMAFVMVGWTVWCASNNINALAIQVERNTIRSELNSEELHHERTAQTGEAVSK